MRRRAGFTLIELMVVILIIALLISISVMVGRTVISGGKVGQTRNVLRAMDVLLNDVTLRDGKIPDPIVEDPHALGRFMPIIDGRNMAVDEQGTELPGFQVINSVGLFLFQLDQSSASMNALEGLDARFRRQYSPYSPRNAETDKVVHEIPTIFDAWDNPIRYVHPAWDGAYWGDDLDNLDVSQAKNASALPALSAAMNVFLPDGGEWALSSVRRNDIATSSDPLRADDFADADGGTSANQRPYFYSMGPDGRVGFDDANGDGKLSPGETNWNEDNVYTLDPLFRD